MNVVNVINLPHRTARRLSATKELEQEGAIYRFWDGMIMPTAKQAISRSHKRIVQHAKKNEWDYCIIAEDDFYFSDKGAWQYFLDNIPKHKEWDLFLSSIYFGEIDENNMTKNFSGLTFYSVNSCYYDIFLSAPETHHLDKALSMMGGIFYVAEKFCALQHPGYSDQRKKYCDDSHRLKNRKIYSNVEVQ